jgi:hypothetical protein
MIRVAVGDDRAIDGPHRIDMETAGLAAQSRGNGHQDILRAHTGYISGRESHSSLAPDDIREQRKSPGLGRGFAY